jgi:hypothetical protein
MDCKCCWQRQVGWGRLRRGGGGLGGCKLHSAGTYNRQWDALQQGMPATCKLCDIEALNEKWRLSYYCVTTCCHLRAGEAYEGMRNIGVGCCCCIFVPPPPPQTPPPGKTMSGYADKYHAS